MSLEVEQAIRKSHCARADKQHECAGTCLITPEGIQLSCKLCGSGEVLHQEEYLPETSTIAKHLFYVAGIDFDALNLERQLDVLNTLQPLLKKK